MTPILSNLSNFINGSKMATIKNSTLDDISAIVGFTATVRLAAHYGGRDMNVPMQVSDLHPIAKLIGMSALARLHAEWQGQRIAVPTLNVAEIELRNAKILQLFLQGKTVVRIAEKTGMTDRRVQQLRRAFESDGILPLIFKTGNLAGIGESGNPAGIGAIGNPAGIGEATAPAATGDVRQPQPKLARLRP